MSAKTEHVVTNKEDVGKNVKENVEVVDDKKENVKDAAGDTPQTNKETSAAAEKQDTPKESTDDAKPKEDLPKSEAEKVEKAEHTPGGMKEVQEHTGVPVAADKKDVPIPAAADKDAAPHGLSEKESVKRPLHGIPASGGEKANIEASSETEAQKAAATTPKDADEVPAKKAKNATADQ